jgi:hypothetical protein
MILASVVVVVDDDDGGGGGGLVPIGTLSNQGYHP